MSKCESCGKNWAEHGGIQATCAENAKLDQARALQAGMIGKYEEENETLWDAVCEAWDALDGYIRIAASNGHVTVSATAIYAYERLGKVIREEPNDKRARIAAVVAAARAVADEYGEPFVWHVGKRTSRYDITLKPSDHMLELVAALKEINS